MPDEPNASLLAKPAAPGLLGQIGSVACAWIELGLISEKAPKLPKLRMVVMKDFFSSSVGESNNDEAHAAKTVRTLLKDIISNEKDTKPYSDEQISILFKNKGVNVARRTVAKYREMLNIPSSAERKRLMRLNKVVNIKS